MKFLFYTVAAVVAMSITSCSCEGFTKKAAKKATNIGLSAVEGVAEAISEKGDSVARKLTDATGEVAEGVGRSLDRQLNEHATHVASVAGRTLVQTVEGLDQGLTKEFYDELVTNDNLCSDVSLDFFGKIKTKAVTDAYFIILKEGTYSFKFEFCSDNCKTAVMTKTAEHHVTADKKYTVVSFAYDSAEETALSTVKCTKVTVTRK